MATEQLMERKTFTVRGRARAPLFASMTQGMTAADLRRSPMPVLGEVSGKAVAEKKKLTFGEVMKKSRDRALRGGCRAGEHPPDSLRARQIHPFVQNLRPIISEDDDDRDDER